MPNIPEHKIGHPFAGYDYPMSRLGADAYRHGKTLHDEPVVTASGHLLTDGQKQSWRYGWYLEQQANEGALEPDLEDMAERQPIGWKALALAFIMSGVFWMCIAYTIMSWWQMGSG